MTSTYSSEEEFRTAVAAHVSQVPPALRGAVVAGIMSGDAALRDADSRRADATLDLRIGRWFIRNDDLPFFESVGVVGTVASTLMATGVLALPAAVAAIAALAGFGWKTWRKGGTLTRDQMTVMTLLHAEGPLNKSELREKIAGLARDPDALDVDVVMRQLKEVELFDGTTVGVVRKNADGKWRLVGV